MLNSQALETAIGLSFFLGMVAITASGLVETFSRVTKKRAIALEHTIDALLSGNATDTSNGGALAAFWRRARKPLNNSRSISHVGAELDAFRKSDAYKAAQAGVQATFLRQKQLPNYLSAQTFVDGAHAVEGKKHVASATLRKQFDEAMGQLSDSYKRWATTVLLIVSIVLCCSTNLNVVRVGRVLWQEEAVRDAAVAHYAKCQPFPAKSAPEYATCNAAIKELHTDLPIGWTDTLTGPLHGGLPTALARLLGYLLTAFLSLLGAQFWFDTAGRLVNLRPSRNVAPPNGGADT